MILSCYCKTSAKNDWLDESLALTLLSRSPDTHLITYKKNTSCAQQKHSFLELSWSPRFTSLFRLFIADHLCWQESTIKMTPVVKITPLQSISLPTQTDLQHLCLLSHFSQTTLSQLWLQHSLSHCFSLSFHLSPVSEPYVPDSLCTICCVHMRFAGSSLSTA